MEGAGILLSFGKVKEERGGGLPPLPSPLFRWPRRRREGISISSTQVPCHLLFVAYTETGGLECRLGFKVPLGDQDLNGGGSSNFGSPPLHAPNSSSEVVYVCVCFPLHIPWPPFPVGEGGGASNSA